MREPKQIKIPFMERFRKPMLNGTKTMTSRTKIYGVKGDFFEAFGAGFKLDSVDTQPFSIIAAQWQAEGCRSQEDFMDVWKQIHPRKVFMPMELLFVHRFHRICALKPLSEDESKQVGIAITQNQGNGETKI